MFPLGSLRRIVAGNTISQLVGKMVSSLSMIILSFFIARQYGSVGYGDFIKVTTYVGFFYLLSDFGLNAIYIQEMMGNRGKGDRGVLWRTLFGLRLFIAFVLMSVAIIIMFMFPQGNDSGYTPVVRTGVYLLIPAIVLQAIITSSNAHFQKLLRYDLAAQAQSIGSVIMVVVAFMLVSLSFLNGSILGVLAMLCGSLVTATVSLWQIRQLIFSVHPIFDISQYRLLLKRTYPLGLALVFNLVYFHADSVILALTRSTNEVGVYGLAYKVFELPLVLPIFFMNAVYPLLLKVQQRRNVFIQSLLFLVVSSLCLAVGLWFGAPIVTLVKPEFVQSIAPLRVLVLGLPLFFVSGLYMWFMISQRLLTSLFMIHGMAMVVNIAANIVFVPIYGYMASAWITILSESMVLIVSVMVVERRGI